MRGGSLRRANPRHPRPWLLAGVVALLSGGYAWCAAVLRPFTLPALAAVLTGGLAALAFGRALPSGRTPSPAGLPRSEVWVGLAAALGLWELASFLHHSRADHPTLSSLINTLFQSHPARAIGLLAWLAVGAGLARR